MGGHFERVSSSAQLTAEVSRPSPTFFSVLIRSESKIGRNFLLFFWELRLLLLLKALCVYDDEKSLESEEAAVLNFLPKKIAFSCRNFNKGSTKILL